MASDGDDGVRPGRGFRAGDTVDTYVIEEPLGEGSAGRVYRATRQGPLGFRRSVALKLVHASAGGSRSGAESLVDEARLGGRLQHPNIAAVLDFGQHRDYVYAVMELADGEPLSRVLGRTRGRGGLPLEVAAGIVLQIGRGLQYAHTLRDEHGAPLGIVHRDIKPSNLVVDRFGVVKILDFGISRSTVQLYRDNPGETRGTPAYMSPEQVRGEAVDARSDLFSLATVFAELVTGHRVFSGTAHTEVLRAVSRALVAPFLQRHIGEDPALPPFLLRAWNPDPRGRYLSAAEMMDALRQACAALGCQPADEDALARWLLSADDDAPTDSLAALAPMMSPADDAGAGVWAEGGGSEPRGLVDQAEIQTATGLGGAWAEIATARVGHRASPDEPVLELPGLSCAPPPVAAGDRPTPATRRDAPADDDSLRTLVAATVGPDSRPGDGAARDAWNTRSAWNHDVKE